jgi:hypothetical protein|tara:strand:- start:362 stop:559 length:198 start_codon:yes stop_codon:yes gene_type:complete
VDNTLGEQMEAKYSKKDIKKSPKQKGKAVQKANGLWYVMINGQEHGFGTEEAALYQLENWNGYKG